MANNSGQQRTIAIAGVLILALLVALGIFISNNMKLKNQNSLLTEQNDETTKLKLELEDQYDTALAELESMRGNNEELNALIETQKLELKEQKDKIDRLLRDNRNLNKARAEITTLNTQVEQYLAEINQLRQENQELVTQTNILTEEKQALSTSLDAERAEKEEIANARATLVSEKEELEKERVALSKKVSIGSVVKVKSINVEGQKIKSSGKAVARNSAKSVDQIQVCFATLSNDITDLGSETFLVRIVNPLGETLAVDNMGSGIFTSNNSGDKIKYTKAEQIDYDGGVNDVCTIWAPDQAFQAGNYEVQVYNKGYLAGSTNFTLKQ